MPSAQQPRPTTPSAQQPRPTTPSAQQPRPTTPSAQQSRPTTPSAQQPRPTTPRTGQAAPVPRTGQAVPRPPAPPVRINPTTTVAARPGGAGVVINHTRPDGSRVVVEQHAAAGGGRQVVAYRESRDAARGTQTRVYTDGHRLTTGQGFVQVSAPRQMTVTRFNNGLNAAYLPNGRPVFRDQFIQRGGQRAIQRTVFTSIVAGRPVALGVPVVRVYAVSPFRGVVIYPYYPVVYQPVYYGMFLSPFPVAVAYGPACLLCPSPVVAFGAPIVAYTDPEDLVGDLQIATAFDDGESELDVADLPPPPPGYAPPPDLPPPPSDADISDLQQEVASLQQQVSDQAATNADLQAQLAAQQDKTAALQAQAAAQQAAARKATVRVPEDVRQQVRREVKEDIALHQQQQPLALPHVMASAEAQNYIFQVSDTIDATTADTGEACSLSTGDLIKFDAVPQGNDPSAPMRVVTSKPGSCGAGAVVQVGMSDLQDMLNGFSERLEANMQKVHDQYAGK
jgi:hypothetical protein